MVCKCVDSVVFYSGAKYRFVGHVLTSPIRTSTVHFSTVSNFKYFNHVI